MTSKSRTRHPDCLICGGNGYLETGACRSCDGTGRAPREPIAHTNPGLRYFNQQAPARASAAERGEDVSPGAPLSVQARRELNRFIASSTGSSGRKWAILDRQTNTYARGANTTLRFQTRSEAQRTAERLNRELDS